jgi:tRNA pseudouridine32 synthase/23S rRNA pseudouridine746 synthase
MIKNLNCFTGSLYLLVRDATPMIAPSSSLLPDPGALSLIHIDRSLIVVEKPARLLSVPGRGPDKQDCLIARLQTEFPDALIVHRLDFDTSGLIVLARGKKMQRALSLLFQERCVEKRYIALVAGKLEKAQGTIDLPLLVDWPNRPLHKVDPINGKPARTHYDCVGYDAEKDASRVVLLPETGRTHQLRVHMRSLGHPILGDPLYGGPAQMRAERLLLHAERLSFAHPVTGKALKFVRGAPF